MSHDTAFPFLTVLVLLPASTAAVAAVIPKAFGEALQRRLVLAVGLIGSLATLALAVTIAVRYRAGDGGYRMVSAHQWAPSLGISWHLGVDGITVFLVLMAAVLFPLVLVGAAERRDPRGYVAWMLLLEAACLGSFVALDLILFFLFFELTLVPVYFVIAGWGFDKRSSAAIKFFVYTFLGSAFLIVGIVALAILHDQQTGRLTFDLLPLMHTHLTSTEQVLLFLSFTAAFAVKAPVWPFHTWSPDAYAQAPTAGAVVLAAVMAKMGTYGIIRFDLSLFPRAVVDLAPLLLTLGVIGILYGALVACAQRDLKRLVAYSSLSHLGFVVLGTFALTTQGLAGGVLQMVNHGLVIALLFILIGWIYERRRTWQADELRGLQRPAPVLAAAFMVALLAAVGLPGLNGFVSEFLVLVGTFIGHRWWAVAATAGVVFTALYLLWAYQRVFHHEPDEQTARTRDLSWREGLVAAPLVALILVLGVYPKPVLDKITPSVNRLVHQVHLQTGTRQPAVATAGPAGAPAGTGAPNATASANATVSADVAPAAAAAGVAHGGSR